MHEAAQVSLRDAMAEAAGHDRIAGQYASDYADIFELGLPWLRAALQAWRDEPWATARVYPTTCSENRSSIARRLVDHQLAALALYVHAE